jgi:hypothetical protein
MALTAYGLCAMCVVCELVRVWDVSQGLRRLKAVSDAEMGPEGRLRGREGWNGRGWVWNVGIW